MIGQKGLSNVTVDMLVQEITPKARSKYESYPLFNIWTVYNCEVLLVYMLCDCVGSVPDYVKKELLQQIKEYLEKTWTNFCSFYSQY